MFSKFLVTRNSTILEQQSILVNSELRSASLISEIHIFESFCP